MKGAKQHRRRREQSEGTAGRPRSWRWLALTLILLAAGLAFANTLDAGFVYDDRMQVVQNPWLRDLSNLPRAFTTNVWAFDGAMSNYYRPWMQVSYILTYQAFGLSAWAFHTVNVLMHLLVTGLVFAFVRATLRAGGVPARAALAGAFCAGLLFATHPIHTEVVAWVACVPDLVFAGFALGTCLLHAREGARARAAAVAVFFAGLFAKEPMVLLPCVLVLWDVSFVQPRPGPRVLLRRHAPYAAAIAAWAAFRFSAIDVVTPLRRHEELGTLDWLANAPSLFAEQLRYLALPVEQSAFHVFHPVESLLEPRALVGFAVGVTFVVALVWALRRDRVVAVALALIGLPLLPVLYIPALGENTFAERYLYVPSIGLVLLVGYGVSRWSMRRPSALRPAVAASVVVAAVFACGTVRRNRVWHDDRTLWTQTCRDSPDSAYAHVELGAVLVDRREYERAVVAYQRAIELDPEMARAHNNLGQAYLSLGKVDLALPRFERAIAVDPTSPFAHGNLAAALLQLGRADEAEPRAREALRLRPQEVGFHLLLGNVLAARGQFAAADAAYAAALALDPARADSYLEAGVAAGRQGKLDAAIELLETAARLAPDDPVIRHNLDRARRLRGDR